MPTCRIIKYYLDQEAILANVETHICRERDGLCFTLDHLEELVVKPVGESGGYGITVGRLPPPRHCRSGELHQPTDGQSLGLSDPDRGRHRAAPRRPAPIYDHRRSTWVLPGGLTRVALRRGSLIVNSSQGGGSKDTWVVV
jgi:uncharacterized circularly permuted ATP-grasp superfamily protein